MNVTIMVAILSSSIQNLPHSDFFSRVHFLVWHGAKFGTTRKCLVEILQNEHHTELLQSLDMACNVH